MSAYLFDPEGRPIDMDAWVAYSSQERHHRVAYTEGRGWGVSTVYLGIDVGAFHHGTPIIYETMVFGGPLDQSQVRYATRAQALDGHRAMVRLAASVDRQRRRKHKLGRPQRWR